MLADPASVRPSYRTTTVGLAEPAGHDSWQTEWLRARGQWDRIDDWERDGVFDVARTSVTAGGMAVGVVALVASGVLTGGFRWDKGNCTLGQVGVDVAQALACLVPGGKEGLIGVGASWVSLNGGVTFGVVDSYVD